MVAFVIGTLLVATLLIRKDNRLANALLAVAISCAIYRQYLITMMLDETILAYPYLIRTTFPTVLLSPAALYLYVVAMTTPGFRLDRRHLLLLLPFAFGVLWWGAFLIFAGNEYFEMSKPFLLESYVRLILKELVQIPFLVLTLRQIWNFEDQIKNHVSNNLKIQVNWIKLLIFCAFVANLVDMADIFSGPLEPIWRIIPYVAGVLAFLLGLFSLYHSAAFARELEQQWKETEPNGNGRLSEKDLQEYSSRLSDFLEREKPYLNPELRLSDLAGPLAIKPYVLSEVIKRSLHTNFYDLINSRRVESAKKRICDPSNDHLNLMGIALDSGFNSKSVFNDVFKKLTGMTPSQFRASHR